MVSGRHRLLHNRDYLVLLSGQTVSSLGTAMTALVFTLLAVDLTGSPVRAGLVGAGFALGFTAASLPAGALVDRLDRRQVLVVTAAVCAVLYTSVVGAILLDRLTVWHLVVVALGTGVGRAFFFPAQTAALRAIVAAEDMGTAMSANEGREHAAALVGGPLGGLLYSVSRVLPVLADAASYVVLTVAFVSLRTPVPAPERVADQSMPAAIQEGLLWVVREPAIRVIALAATLLNFSAGAIVLVLIVSLQQTGTSSGVIGLLETGIGIGGLLGAVLSARLLARFATGRVAVVAVWVFTGAFVLTATTSAPWLLVLLLGTAMLTVPAFNAGLFGYQILVTPDDMQGRAQSAIGFVATSLASLAPLAGGALLSAVGLRPSILVLCALMALGGVAITVSGPIRRIPLLASLTPHDAPRTAPTP